MTDNLLTRAVAIARRLDPSARITLETPRVARLAAAEDYYALEGATALLAGGDGEPERIEITRDSGRRREFTSARAAARYLAADPDDA